MACLQCPVDGTDEDGPFGVRPAPFVARLAELAAFVKRMGRETNQGAIALEFDGNFFTVEDFAPNH